MAIRNLYAEVAGAVTPIYSCILTKRANEVDRFEVKVPRRVVKNYDTLFADIRIFQDEQLILSGYVEDDQGVSFSDEQLVLSTLVCYGELGRLTLVPGRATLANFVHHLSAGIIEHLLAYTSDWQIGNLATMTSHVFRTTVQLQFKATIWSQITSLLSECPDHFVRYGGINSITGKHQLELGKFESQGYIRRIDESNLLEPLEIQPRTGRPLRAIKPFGGMYRNTSNPSTIDGQVNVLDALLIQPGLATDPSFPLLTDGEGNGYVQNNAVAKGAFIVKNYDSHKVESAALDVDMRRFAALGVYHACVRDLQEQHEPINISTKVALPAIPESMEVFRIVGRVIERVYDQLSGRLFEEEVFGIDQRMQVTGITVNLFETPQDYDLITDETRDYYVVGVELSATGFSQVIIPNEVVLLAVKGNDYNRRGQDSHVNVQEYDDSVTHVGVPSDASIDGTLAKEFIIYNMDMTVGLSLYVGFSYEVSDPTVKSIVTQYPSLNGVTPLKILVSGAKGNSWTTADNITVNAFFVGIN